MGGSPPRAARHFGFFHPGGNMALVKKAARKNGHCKKGSRRVKGRKGCWAKSGGAKKKKKGGAKKRKK